MSKLAESLRNQGLIGDDEAKIADVNAYDDGVGGTFTDADTIKRNGETYRLTGFDAREVDKFYDNKFQAGDIGGAEQTIAVADLARKHGYNKLVPQGGPGSGGYGRIAADLVNAQGESLSHRLQTSGLIQNSDVYRDQDTQAAASFSHLARQARAAEGVASDWDIAAAWIDESIGEQTKYEPQFKQVALDERQLAEAKAAGLGNHFTNATVDFRSTDRDLANRARNPLSVSWDIGVKGAIEGLTGMVELIGHETGWEGLENWAEGSLTEQRYDLQNMPKVITDFRDVDGVGDFVQYVGNLGAMSLPYMINTIAATALAPVTGGLSLASPAAVYAGQVWNEMGDTDEIDKNAGLAVAAGISMAALDRLGVKGLSNTTLLSSAGRKELLKQGIPEADIVNATRRAAAEMAQDSVKFSKDLLNKKLIATQFLSNATRGAATEGATEVAQETVAALAAHAGAGKSAAEFDWDDFLERIQQAAVGGGVLGAGFAVPGTAYDAGQWADVAYRQAPADTAKQVRQSRWREQEIADTGKLRTVAQLQEDTEKQADERQFSADVTQRADEDTRRGRSGRERFDEIVEGVPGLWRGITRHIFTDEIQDKSKAARYLADMFGGNLQQTHSGATYETAKSLRLAEYKGFLDVPGKTFRDFGLAGVANEKARESISSLMYSAYQDARNPDGTVDWKRLEGNSKYADKLPLIKKFAGQLDAMTQKMWQDQRKYNPELGFTEGYAFRAKALDKAKIEQDANGFRADLMSRFDLDESSANTLIDKILNSGEINNIDDAFSVTDQGGFKPGSHSERTLNLSDDPNFSSKWLSNDIFHNVSAAAKSAVRYTTYQDYIGDGNKKINELFQQMEEELTEGGLTPQQAKEQVNKKARQFRDYLDAESGNYKRPKTDLGRNLQKIQKNIMFYTTLAGLPLATLSSLVEFAIVFKSLKPGQINNLSNISKEFAEAFWNDTKKIHDNTPARKALRETGLFEWETGAATITGVTEQTNVNSQRLDLFFKAIGLTQWTDYTRALRASFGLDYITAQMDIITKAGETQTNEELEARDGLSAIGINLPRFTALWQQQEAGPLPEAEATEMSEMVKLATFNWVNDAIVLPQAANRPLFYQNPQLALFTQFHGFISTFTANHLPKLYRDAFRGKTPSMKYNAFAVMTTMIMLGFLSQYLKDLLKYGETPEWLTTEKLVQRGVGASGLLGTGERVLNLFNPIYETRYNNSIERLFGELAGESAAITNLERGVEAGGELVTGDPEQAYRKGSKLLPLVGPLNALHEKVQDTIF